MASMFIVCPLIMSVSCLKGLSYLSKVFITSVLQGLQFLLNEVYEDVGKALKNCLSVIFLLVYTVKIK